MRWVMDRLVSWLVLVVIVCVLPGCGCVPDPGDLLPNESGQEIDTSHDRLIARFAHVTDTHVMDVMSPARFPPADVVIGSSWRSQEAYSTQFANAVLIEW